MSSPQVTKPSWLKSSPETAIQFTVDTITSRQQRVIRYFPELHSIVTNGASTANPESLNTLDVICKLEEGTFPYHILRDGTKLDQFIKAIQALEGITEWGKWGVDSANHEWAAIWTRLVDKLQVAIAKNPAFKSKLTSDDDQKIQAIYERYKAIPHGVDDRRKKHDQFDREFNDIFGDNSHRELRQVLTHPLTGEFTPKHAGQQLLLLIEDPEQRKEFINRYFDALDASAKVPQAKKLADYMAKHIKKFSKEFKGQVPQDIAELVQTRKSAFDVKQSAKA